MCHNVTGEKSARMRVVFYAEPKNMDEAHSLKTKADNESLGAEWLSLDEI